jgi:transcriptional pleiotropic regulator of transition state genes
MKATGIVRRIDELGRVVLPKELRTIFNIDHGDALEVFTEGDSIILKLYQPGCQADGCTELDVVEAHGVRLCKAHAEAIYHHALEA